MAVIIANRIKNTHLLNDLALTTITIVYYWESRLIKNNK